jgi:hypothetical protein
MTTISKVIIVVLVLGTLFVHLGNYWLRQQKDWRAKGLLFLGCVLAVAIAAQFYVNSKLTEKWTLSDSQTKRLSQLLCQRPTAERYKVRILVLPSEQNPGSLGSDLHHVFYKCQWDTEYVNDYTLGTDLVGVSVQVPNGTLSVADAPFRSRDLVGMLKTAGITNELRQPGTATQWDSAAISVGAKPQ